jgi:DNA-binding CsgD family transcriptional regulator
MSGLHFFSDDFFFLNGMGEHYKSRCSSFEFINTCGNIDSIKDKIDLSCSRDIFVFSFECKDLFRELLMLDGDRVCNFVVIIDTPMSIPWVRIGNWFVTSKFSSFSDIDQAINQNRTHLTERGPLFFTEREKAVWTLLRGGKTINEIARYFRLSPKTVYAFRSTALRKIRFERRNELAYIKYGRVFHG